MLLETPINILLTDDHELIRAGLKHILESEPGINVVGEASNGEEAVRMLRELSPVPQIVLLDIKMPGIGGLETARRMLHINPDLRILVVTVCDNVFFPARLLKIGVVGYLTKGASKDELLQAVYALTLGGRYISSKIAQKMILKQLDTGVLSPFELLTNKELQVALMVVQGHKNKEIAAKMCLSNKTVNSYRYRIFTRLKVKGDVELTRLAQEHQLI